MLGILHKDFRPKANPNAIVQHGPIRFTVLTAKLLRMEYNPDEEFEDRPTQVFWYREFPVPEFSSKKHAQKIVLETDALILEYKAQDLGFHESTLQVKLKNSGLIWKYGQENNTNLKGTVRTLDQVNGATLLNNGLISRTGWAVIDDSESLVFNEDGWLAMRSTHPNAKDLYFFGYGQDFTDCIVDFQKLSGSVPILPRFALGNWWSRYWAYHQDELLKLMQEFHERDVPLSVCIVDMDWHITDTGNESSGWTGYTWNPELFPEPNHFLDELHHLGLKTALNLHPASGIYPHEAQYEAMAQRMGIDPETKQPIPFDIANPDFAEAYFDILHHPLEDIGVDFWWLDWQQGSKTSVEGLDPLFWLNHLHFYDRTRNGVTRPFIFSRWGGLGGHRYPIGFSGDTYVTWETLHFQPYFTATAANVGYGWWSHDIGGHMGGVEDPELYLRWVQYGVFSPILRLHSTNNPFHERKPWGFDAETFIQAKKALKLRHALIPYLYTAAWRNHKDGILPIRPMYHLHPENASAYNCPNEYTFGSELIAAPFTLPRDENTRLSRQVVWLPEGHWFDFFTGEVFQGEGWHAIYGQLDKTPVFARAGAIIPMEQTAACSGISLPDALTINIFPGANNTYQLYEDDGETLAYEDGEFALSTFKQTWSPTQIVFEIAPVEGKTDLIPVDRTFKLIFFAIYEPEEILIRKGNKIINTEWYYSKDAHQLVIPELRLPDHANLMVELSHPENLLLQINSKRAQLEKMLKMFKMNTAVKLSFHNKLDEFMTNPMLLKDYADRMTETQLLALVETWLGYQPEKISDDSHEAFQKIINMIY